MIKESAPKHPERGNKQFSPSRPYRKQVNCGFHESKAITRGKKERREEKKKRK